jgi:hypothetical protein
MLERNTGFFDSIDPCPTLRPVGIYPFFTGTEHPAAEQGWPTAPS